MNAGMFLRSTPLLDDSFFERTELFITEVNDKGAMGFVVNKPFPRKFNELVEFRHSIAFPLYDGGPVDREHLYFIHRRPDLIEGGVLVAGDIYLGGDFKAAVKYINNKTITENDIRLFIGYCGWDSFELEEEIAEGSWEIIETGNLF
ncbi:YqgE/AlgH family protein [Chitinophaga polysaccharea]|uniref:YqgE/AlgH family protein n=1 Tax=Chitinophaga TaxID=79328 RepID=UPI001455C124|nr:MULTISPECIES: YqgE/AlgH family protein [Chitinophaga]NLR58275.1 YqgE/AlgH family protein [Chitinophaga polysaccharea]NLU90801.1 YqgE/AlgH family protein [Chitinophaga sp. Ak27]